MPPSGTSFQPFQRGLQRAAMGGRAPGLAQPTPLQAPTTTTINGQTYQGRAARPDIPGQTKTFAPGTMWGADDSEWTPMAPAGGGGGGGGVPGLGGGGGGQSPLPMPQIPMMPLPIPSAPGVARVQPPGLEDSTGADNAAYSRARARIANVGRGAMTALHDEYNARGLGGSRSEMGDAAGVVGATVGQNSEVIRDQAIEGLRRAQSVNDRNYAGDLTQRGQDIGFQSTQRGQDIEQNAQQTNAIQRLLEMIQSGRRSGLY